jgi:hypothetical protein
MRKVYSRCSQCLLPSLDHKFRFDSQSAHRVAMATFWRTFNPNGKISPACWSWGLPRPSPFTLSIQSTSKVVVYAQSERANTPPSISPLPLRVLCGSIPRSHVQLKGQWDFWQKNYILMQFFHRPLKNMFSASRIFGIGRDIQKIWWHDATLIVNLLFKTHRITFIHSSIKSSHSLRPAQISSLLLLSIERSPLECRVGIRTGPAEQQADTLQYYLSYAAQLF